MCIRDVEIKGSGRIQDLRSQIFRWRCGRTRHRLRECERCDIEGPKSSSNINILSKHNRKTKMETKFKDPRAWRIEKRGMFKLLFS